MRRKRRILLVMAIGLVSFTLWVVIVVNKPQLNGVYNNFGDHIPTEYPVLGIDVSHYQGDINWNQVSEMRIETDSIQFAYIKATEGTSVRDDRKRTNAQGARSVEIDYGFYHFYIPTLSARKQALFFSESIGGYNFDLKPVLDVEAEHDFSNQRLLDSVTVFLNVAESQLGVRPVIYTYSNYFDRFFYSSNEVFWVAKYSRDCPAMEKQNVVCWQFSETGTVDGINEYVDLNVAKKNFFEVMKR